MALQQPSSLDRFSTPSQVAQNMISRIADADRQKSALREVCIDEGVRFAMRIAQKLNPAQAKLVIETPLVELPKTLDSLSITLDSKSEAILNNTASQLRKGNPDLSCSAQTMIHAANEIATPQELARHKELLSPAKPVEKETAKGVEVASPAEPQAAKISKKGPAPDTGPSF